MEAIQLVIAFQGQPSDVVEPGQPFTSADIVEYFWESKDFEALPLELRSVLDETL